MFRKDVQISISIVVYKENIEELRKLVNCLCSLKTTKHIFLIDNSHGSQFKDKFEPEEIDYITTGKNIGFAAGNNLVIPRINDFSSYHLVLNPDVNLEPKIIEELIVEMERNKNIAIIAPGVLNFDGSHQITSRRYPTILELIYRFLRISSIKVKRGNYGDKDLSKPFYVDVLHGCFLLFRTEDFIKIKGFDSRYFLYMEDVDICRKIDTIEKKKLYFPQLVIHHALRKGSSKNLKLFYTHLTSVIKYFNKWGWRIT